MSSTKKIFFCVLFLISLIFLRFYNLQISARFIWDESSDLVRMYDIYQRPRLTLIGPISEDGIKIFGSLSYYMTLPFVILFNFDPVSSAYASAFFGVLTIILMMFLLKIKKLPLLAGAFLLLFSYPLLEAARWAWNPHFIPFWQVLGLLAYLKGGGIFLFFSGLFFGLTTYNHYYAIFAAVGMALVVFLNGKKKFKELTFFGLGIISSLIPFLVFDLTNPPGLFLSRMLFFSPVSASNGGFQISSILHNLTQVPLQFTSYLSGGNKLVGIIVLVLSITNVFLTIKKKKSKWLVVILVQLLALSMIGGGIFNHYLLAIVIFYYLWLLSSFQKVFLSKIIIILLIITNFFFIREVLFKKDWSTNIESTKKIVEIIEKEYRDDVGEFNLAVLGSPNPNTKGRRYRDLLRLKNVPVASTDNYSNINKVFFISYLDWNELKNDSAYEINDFREKSPKKNWKIDNSEWKVYMLQK